MEGNRTRVPQGHLVGDGPLAGHYKVGRKYRPLMVAYPQTAPNDWIRDDLPDLLWPLVVAVKTGDRMGRLFTNLQQVVLDAIPESELDANDCRIDGRMSSLERFPVGMRGRIKTAIQASSDDLHEIFPEEIREVLSLYDDPPGAWLLMHPWDAEETHQDPESAVDFLVGAIISAMTRNDVNALVKAPPMSWLVLRGRLRMPAEMIDVLKNYPIDPSSRPRAEAVIMSSFLSMKGADTYQDPDRYSLATDWAGRFWAHNWAITFCYLDESPEPDSAQDEDKYEQESKQALAKVNRLWKDFVQDAMDRDTPVNLQRPARHEVLCGLVVRALRAVASLVSAPNQWNGEFGSNTIRLLTESKIVMRWLLAQEGDEGFEEFQNYGRGKRKLLRYQADELMGRFEGNPPEFLLRYAEQLEKDAGGKWAEEFQEVSLESTFAGLTLREMADATGSMDEYRHMFQSASGVMHGEWWSLEDYVLQRCKNPLHLFHWVPRASAIDVTPELIPVLLNQLRDLIDLATQGLISRTIPNETRPAEAD